MVYHWKSVNNIHLGWFLDQAMTKIGPYSVCAFFVLSGMSLGLVYSGRNIDRKFLVEFAIKRLFRIVPLFWITIILTILLDAWQRGSMADFPSFHRLALNLSMLFSWVEPTASIPMGGWSIADEMVFYSLFPVVLFLSRKSSQTAFLIVIIALAFGAVFAFHLLDPSVNWDPQWALYVNPLNHLFLFVVGVVTAVRRLRLPLTTRWMAPALFFCILAFVMVPANGAELFSGFGRVCYSSLAILICWIVLDWKSGVGSFAPLLTWIGWISYGVYLLHPIFIRASIFFIAYQLNRNPALISLCVGIPATLIGATVSWVCFEKPMMQLGRRFLKTRA